MTDLQFMAVVTVAAAVGIGVAGGMLVRRARRRSLSAALVVAALVPFGAVVVAVAVNVNQMFLSSHDAGVVWFVLAVSSVLAVVLAVLLGRTLGSELKRVADDARGLVDDGHTSVQEEPTTAELAHLSAELVETRARLATARERERAAEEARRQVVAFVSHDLRSPLAGIQAASQGLRDGVFPEPGTALDGIESAVGRMARMIDDLAELSRPDGAGRSKGAAARLPAAAPGVAAGGPGAGPGAAPVAGSSPAPAGERVDLAAVVRDVVAHAVPVATDAGVLLESRVEDGVVVPGDADGLGRLLDNLVTNAVRSSGAGGHVRVAVTRAGGVVRIVVQDTCGGIPEHVRERVLEPGFRAGERPGSSGLGLAIVDRVVEQHGGSVDVGSTPEGCSVEVRVPAS
ncbi:HAMP domain-containing sensor histidine kinase [Cellulomonas sp. PhB143]|uniref:sensor histidine kinase n=1 Tax=Cellulomonas sp. PhB143 TaxID=2485186 RepID=UPI000F485BD0|nr:HAMP domain-containing sensor histidine kinase [Cellulomonas sp. PhB143]ROS72062.1 histidine kinase [Cellulomonas sp. PhB143]